MDVGLTCMILQGAVFTSIRRKGKKAPKRTPRTDMFSSRLLWNPNGCWKDKWFTYQDGILSGFKDVGFKPADVILDMKTCKITSYPTGDVHRQLNLFKLTTSGGVTHYFAAWSEDVYESWLEIFSCICIDHVTFREEEEHLSTQIKLKDDDFSDSALIPYDRALSDVDPKQLHNSSSSEHSCTPVDASPVVDSVDSGNDGDESGLDVPLSNLDVYELRQRQQKERELFLNSATRETLIDNGSTVVEGTYYPSRVSPPKTLDLFPGRQQSKDSTTSTDGDPLVSPTSSVEGVVNDTTVTESSGKSKRLSRNRWSLMDPTIAERYRSKTDSDVVISRSGKSLLPASPDDLNLPTSNQLRTRNCNSSSEIDLVDHSTSHAHQGSLDSNYSDSWEVFRDPKERYKKGSMGSEDDNASVNSYKEDDEDKVREETLLRKRRNSLTLEQTTIKSKLEALRSEHKKNKDDVDAPVVDVIPKEQMSSSLEQRLKEIDSEIVSIDTRMTLNVNPMLEKAKKNPRRHTTNAFMTKFRRPKNRNNLTTGETNMYMSMESLASTASRESKESSRESKESPSSIRRQMLLEQPIEGRKVTAAQRQRFSNCSEQSVGSLSSSNDPSELKPNSPILRTRSVGTLLKSGNGIDENHNTSTNPMEALQNIKDFEEFSAKLSNQMSQQRLSGVIDV